MPKYSWKQKHVRKLLSKMKKNKAFEYSLSGNYDTDSVFSFLGRMQDDYPQYTGRYNIALYHFKGQTRILFQPGPEMGKCIKATKVINSIAKKANRKKSQRSKVKYINDRLCRLCSYDYAAARRGYSRKADAYTIYGCLVRGKAVCAGYSRSFRAIAVRCGIRSKFGRSPNHVWNKVKIGKRWYHVDVTWNDCQKHNKTKYLLKKKHR
jgi:transglutaminase/protease-like cytokinesis protein 3